MGQLDSNYTAPHQRLQQAEHAAVPEAPQAGHVRQVFRLRRVAVQVAFESQKRLETGFFFNVRFTGG